MAPPEDEFDVARIMAAIRAENRRQRELGTLTPEDVEAQARQRFSAWAEKAHIDPRLLDRFLAPGHDWNIASGYLVRSHRRGPLAWLSVLAKRLVRPIVRLYTDHLLDRQTQINNYFFHVLTNAIRENVRLEARVRALERQRAARDDR